MITSFGKSRFKQFASRRLQVEPLETRLVLAADVIITEFMANNENGLLDYDDDRSDWIELKNVSDAAVELQGYYLSDEPSDLQKWRIRVPQQLGSGDFLVVFASGKDDVARDGQLHTNFQLAREGEYLALVEPDGVTIAWEFAAVSADSSPGYPIQYADISFGISVGTEAGPVGYFAVPTPGESNGPSQPAVAHPPEFSRSGGIFTDEIPLSLTTQMDRGVIHYTTDGSTPTLESPVYDSRSPLSITSTMRVRAVVAAPDHVTSWVVSRDYVKIAPDIQSFSSSLPIVVLDSFGAPYDSRTMKDSYWAIFEPSRVDGRASLFSEPQLQTRAGIRFRGNSSLNVDKKAYRLEAWDELENDTDVTPLGMPADSDWILNARGTRFDRSLMSNAFMYELSNQTGRYAVRTRFVEVFANNDNGILSHNDYVGVFTLMENIKRGDERVDIEKLSKNYDRELPVTGGYILKFDQPDDGDQSFLLAGERFIYVEPQPHEMIEPAREPQREYISGYIEQVIASMKDRDPDTGYARFIDVDSWIDHHLMNVLANNGDALRVSAYMFKHRGGKLEAGPIWDFDRALGAHEGTPRRSASGWIANHFSYFWWDNLFDDPDFRQQYVDRYQDLRESVWSNENIDSIILDLADQITDEAAQRNYQRWPSPFLADLGWPGEVDDLRRWLQDRLSWIDDQLIPKPTVRTSADDENGDHEGPLLPGTTVQLMLPPGAPPTTKLFYTLDGSDPRLTSYEVLPDEVALRRDFHATADATFVIDVADGSYEVHITSGDVADAVGEMTVFLEDQQVDAFEVPPGSFVANRYLADVDDGQLTLSLRGSPAGPAVINRLQITPPDAHPLAIDFGPANAPVADGYVGVGNEGYDQNVGYGWTAGSTIAFDRGEPDALRADFVRTRDAEFAVDLPNGTYNVSVVMGDQSFVRDRMQLTLEPESMFAVSDEASVGPGQFFEQSYLIRVQDGQLNVQIEDFGGDSSSATVNALVVTPVLAFDFGTASSPVGNAHVRVDEDAAFSPQRGYGWSGGDVASVDRAADVDGGGVAPSAIEYIGGDIELNGSTIIRARALEMTSSQRFSQSSQTLYWSGIEQRTFAFETNDLVISELNYHPPEPTDDELSVNSSLTESDFEFVEIQNSSAQNVELTGYRLAGGIDFSFPDFQLAAGEYGVVVRNGQAFELRYGSGVNVIGEFADGRLSNAGERLQLLDSLDQLVMEIQYGDRRPWPERADGAGGTLELISPTTDKSELGEYYSWRGSSEFSGSPGRAGNGSVGVVIHEVLTNTDGSPDPSDSIELFNMAETAIDLGGWYLSDSRDDWQKFRIPDGTVMRPREYLVFDESDFNRDAGDQDSFALSGQDGDDVWLLIGDGFGRISTFVDDVHFGAASVGESLGRVVGGPSWLSPLGRVTFGGANSGPRVGPLVISEVNYRPGPISVDALDIEPDLSESDLEYLEIHNPTQAEVDLSDWRVRGGVDLEFDPGTRLGAGQTVVILSFNPMSPANANRRAAFQAQYGLDDSVRLMGGYAGHLSNSGARIELQRGVRPSEQQPELVSYWNEDEVTYDNASPPWPMAAGTGNSLARRGPVFYGNSAVSWMAAAPTPGEVDFGDSQRGDFSGEGNVSWEDIDSLYDAIRRDSDVLYYDLDASTVVDTDDVRELVEGVLGTSFGDADLDGRVVATDLNRVGLHWLYEGVTGWREGDFTGDGRVDAADLNEIVTHWQHGVGVDAQAASVARLPRAPLGHDGVAPAAALVDLDFAPLGSPAEAIRSAFWQRFAADDHRGNSTSLAAGISVRSRVVAYAVLEPLGVASEVARVQAQRAVSRLDWENRSDEPSDEAADEFFAYLACQFEGCALLV